MEREERIDLLRRRPELEYVSRAQLERELEIEDEAQALALDERFLQLAILVLSLADDEDIEPDFRRAIISEALRLVYLQGGIDQMSGRELP